MSLTVELSEAEVCAWLAQHHYGVTALELHCEMRRCGTAAGYPPLLSVANDALTHWRGRSKGVGGNSSHAVIHGVGDSRRSLTTETRTALVDCLALLYAQEGGQAAVQQLFAEAIRQCEGVAETRDDVAHSVDMAPPCHTVPLSPSSTAVLATPMDEATTLTRDVGGAPSSSAQLLSSDEALWHRRCEELEVAQQQLSVRLTRTEARLRHAVDRVTEALPALIAGLDVARKETLLPLLSLTAIDAASQSVRTASRRQLLALFRRPTREQRGLIVKEWLTVARAAAPPVLEQEVIPELYALVNAGSHERRLLALRCAAAIAPSLRQLSHRAARLLYTLSQGLLRPLSEDGVAAVRREVPACAVALWAAQPPPTPSPTLTPVTATTTVTALLPGGPVAGNGDGVVSQRPPHESSGPSETTTTAPTQPPSPSERSALTHGRHMSQSMTFYMELMLRLAIDENRTVRHAAHMQLRERVFPRCVRDGTLLSTVVPLIMTFIAMEVTPVRLDERGRTTLTPQDDPRSPLSLALDNATSLIRLLSDAIRCIAAALCDATADATTSEMDDKAAKDDAGRQGTMTTAGLRGDVGEAFVGVVLPSAASLIPALSFEMTGSALGNPLPMTAAAAATRDGAGVSIIASGTAAVFAASGGQRPCGPLCGLAAVLATLVPVLDAEATRRVMAYLTAMLHSSHGALGEVGGTHTVSPPVSSASSFVTVSNATSSCLPRSSAVEHGTTTPARAARLGFVYAFLIRLAGEQAGEARSVAARAGDSLARQSCALLTQSLFDGGCGDETAACMESCAQALTQLGAVSLHDEHLLAGVQAVVSYAAEAAQPELRLRAIALMTRVCALLGDGDDDDTVKSRVICPPLRTLVTQADVDADVVEAALRALVKVAVYMRGRKGQDEVLQPAFACVARAGPLAPLTTAFLQEWESVMPTMAAEPREALLYPYLAALMVLLAQDVGHEEGWTRVMVALHALLQRTLRSAVVTPSLVATHLVPGVERLTSERMLAGATPTVRSRWLRLGREVQQFIATSKGVASGTPAGGSSGASGADLTAQLISRVKDELRKHF